MAKKKIILCDTDVLIEHFHGNQSIVKELDTLGFERLSISVVTVGEIYFGMRKRETAATRDLIRRFNLLHIDKTTSQTFIQLMLGYKSKGISVPDAFIAATALTQKVELFTLNRSDYNFIEGLTLYNPQF